MAIGKLYMVPTPIGNLKDMTFRAVEVLNEVDTILSEDTRTTGVLLKHFEISTKQASYHMHNEHKVLAGLVERLKAGENMALVTDAGTPGISDPGFLLVRECAKEGVPVETLPGATAFVPALVNSGLPCDRFTFEGFLPQKKGRQTKFQQLAQEERTMVFYESPHRLIKTLTQMKEFWGERQASVSRELSKLHEENINGTLTELIDYYTNKGVKGEIVLVVAGYAE